MTSVTNACDSKNQACCAIENPPDMRKVSVSMVWVRYKYWLWLPYLASMQWWYHLCPMNNTYGIAVLFSVHSHKLWINLNNTFYFQWKTVAREHSSGAIIFSRDYKFIITLVRHKKARFDNKMHGSTQKSRFDTKMPGSTQKCPPQHAPVAIAIIKHPPHSCEKFFFSNFIPIFF